MKKLLAILSITAVILGSTACNEIDLKPADEKAETQITTTTQSTPSQFTDMPSPFGGGISGIGGDGQFYRQCGNDKLDGFLGHLWDDYVEYLGEKEMITDWYEHEGETFPPTSIMAYQNIYSLAVINDIPMEFVIESIDKYNEYQFDLMLRSFESGHFLPNTEETKAILQTRDAETILKHFSDEPNPYLYTEDDKSALLTRDEEMILKQFANPYAIIIKDKVYTPAWLYNHTPDDYRKAGITPEMLEEKLDLYAEILFTDEADRAFSAKLTEFMGEEVSLKERRESRG